MGVQTILMLRFLTAGLLLIPTTASAQSLNFIGNRPPQHGAKTTVAIQGEGSCAYHQPTPATFSVGGGQAQPLMLPGTFGHGTAVPTPSSVADTNTVFGAFITVPLNGRGGENCDEYLLIQRSRARLKLASELRDAGDISEEQYAAISAEVFAVVQ